MRIKELEQKAIEIRMDIISMSYSCGRAAHPGPALSCADIITALYFQFMNNDPLQPEPDLRDKLILSKGHACPAQYAALAEKGYFSKKEFENLRHPNAILQGHPCYNKTPGIDMTTGSLGNGLGIGAGMAYYFKLKGSSRYVYVILGDGEMNEGTVWEAIMYAPSVKLNNLIAFVDINKFQSCGACEDILPQFLQKERWECFGWHAQEIDGHSMEEIVDSIEKAHEEHEKPSVILANTIKGKGISFMENNNSWHQRKLDTIQYTQALKELEEKYEKSI